MKFKNNKKSQIEMFGMVVLVLVILIFFLFFLSFFFKQKRSSPYDYYFSQSLKTTFVSSLLQTNTNCDSTASLTIQSLIEFCVTSPDEVKYCKNGMDYCAFLNNTLKHILNITLRNYQKDYIFVIKTSRGNVYFEDKFDCDQEKTKKLETQPFLIPLPSGRETIQIALFLC
ncbi:MAG: hypothetical protein QXS41_02760 [Candidatus Woesearchaeota archaeon]